MDNLIIAFVCLFVSLAACIYMTWINRSTIAATGRWLVSKVRRRQPALKLYGEYHDVVLTMLMKRAQLKEARLQAKNAVTAEQGYFDKAKLDELEREYPDSRKEAAKFLCGLRAEDLLVIAEIESLRLFQGLIPSKDIIAFLEKERGLVEIYPRLMEDHLVRKVLAFGDRYRQAMGKKNGSDNGATDG